jgi:phage replication initiation protein
MEAVNLGDGSSSGQTWYFGSRQSNTMARFYDKAAEQGLDTPWLRVELELKNHHASQAMEWISRGMDLGELAAGYLRSYLNFVEKSDSDTNKARWEVAAWWEDWLGEVEKLRFVAVERTIKTIEQAKAWVKKQVGPTIATIWQSFGGDAQELAQFCLKVAFDGAPRMKERHRLMLSTAGAGAW